MAEAAPTIAKARKAIFDAHIAAGFSEAQALQLTQKIMVF